MTFHRVKLRIQDKTLRSVNLDKSGLSLSLQKYSVLDLQSELVIFNFRCEISHLQCSLPKGRA